MVTSAVPDKERKVRLYFRGDAAFASPEIYEYLEAEGLLYVIRLKAKFSSGTICLRDLSVARPTIADASFSYQVVAKVEWQAGSSRRFHRH